MILGIDYGRKRIGLAFAESGLSEPYRVIDYDSHASFVAKIKAIIQEMGITRIVIGVSSGTMAEESRRFSHKIAEEVKIPIVFQDETLSTKEALKYSIQAGIRKSKRKRMIDAYSAAIILQNYLDK